MGTFIFLEAELVSLMFLGRMKPQCKLRCLEVFSLSTYGKKDHRGGADEWCRKPPFKPVITVNTSKQSTFPTEEVTLTQVVIVLLQKNSRGWTCVCGAGPKEPRLVCRLSPEDKQKIHEYTIITPVPKRKHFCFHLSPQNEDPSQTSTRGGGRVSAMTQPFIVLREGRTFTNRR